MPLVSLSTGMGGLVDYLWAVGGAHEQHAPVGRGRVAAVHLDQHLRLQAPGRLVLPSRQPTEEQSATFCTLLECPGLNCASHLVRS